MQQPNINDQAFTYNGLMNSNLLSPTYLQSLPVTSEMQNLQQHSLGFNVMFNQPGLMFATGQQVGQPNLMLNSQNLNTNLIQQANSLSQFCPSNSLLSSGQPMYSNFYHFPSLQNCMQTIVIPSTNLISSSIPPTIIGTLPNQQKQHSKSKKKVKKLTKQLSTKENRENKLNRTEQNLVENDEDNEINSEQIDNSNENLNDNLNDNLNHNLAYNQMEVNINETDDETINQDEISTDSSSDEEINDNSDDDEIQIVINNKPNNNRNTQMVHDLSYLNDDDNESSNGMSFDNQSFTNKLSNRNDALSENSNEMAFDNRSIDSPPDLSRVKKEEENINEFRKINFGNLSKEDCDNLIMQLKKFAHKFKIFRTEQKITQETASKDLSKFIIKFSQSKLCRFEKISEETFEKFSENLSEEPSKKNLSEDPLKKNLREEQLRKKLKKLRSALMTKEILEKYMLIKSNKITELGNLYENKQRKKRTNFTQASVKILNDFFESNSHPSIEEIEELSRQTKYSFDEIKNWFNNRRQSSKKASKSTIEQSDL